MKRVQLCGWGHPTDLAVTTVPAGVSAAGTSKSLPADPAYFHSQNLLFVFPSASASYSKTTATVFRRLSFGESL